MNKGNFDEGRENLRRGVQTDPGSPSSTANSIFDHGLTSESSDMIGKHLRTVYSDMVAEPLPGRFADLLGKLAQSDDQ